MLFFYYALARRYVLKETLVLTNMDVVGQEGLERVAITVEQNAEVFVMMKPNGKGSQIGYSMETVLEPATG